MDGTQLALRKLTGRVYTLPPNGNLLVHDVRGPANASS